MIVKYRTPRESNKYYLPKQYYITAIHYAKQYSDWQKEYDSIADTAKAIVYDKDKVQTSNQFDSTQETAIRLALLAEKMQMVDDTITEVCAGETRLERFIKLGVCYGMTYWQLSAQAIPCGKDKYYEMRQHFYYLLSKKI